MQDPQEPITLLLGRTAMGDAAARDELFRLVYETLRRRARALVAREGRRPGMEPTELVHEAYFRLFIHSPLQAPNRAYFFGAAALAMRRILIERGRDPKAKVKEVTLVDAILETITVRHRVDVLDVDRALSELEGIHARQAQVVTLRFFGGLKWEEIGVCLGVSTATVEKDWQVARAWLHARLHRDPQ